MLAMAKTKHVNIPILSGFLFFLCSLTCCLALDPQHLWSCTNMFIIINCAEYPNLPLLVPLSTLLNSGPNYFCVLNSSVLAPIKFIVNVDLKYAIVTGSVNDS